MDWILGAVVLLIAFLYKPSLSFKWAKLTFRIRRSHTRFKSETSMNYRLGYSAMDVDIKTLKEALDDTGQFESIELIATDREDRVQVGLKLDDAIQSYSISLVHNVDSDDVLSLVVYHEDMIVYKEIGDFLDLAIAARGLLFNALNSTNYRPIEVPELTVRVSLDSRKLKVIPWLDRDYEFSGAILVEGSDIVISQGENEAIVRSGSATPLFKDILRSLVVDNFSK